MIGRGLALAGKSFQAASAAVGGLGGGSDGSGSAAPGPQAVSRISATNQARIFESRLQRSKGNASPPRFKIFPSDGQ